MGVHPPAVATPRSVSTARPRAPLVWLLRGDRPGDNQQAEAVAKGLPWPAVDKYVRVRAVFAERKPRVRASLHHLDLAGSDRLAPPWPDLVVTMGRRLSMVALWIRKQHAASGASGRTRIVLVGKPSGRSHEFDLVVASAETPLPPQPHVMPIGLPLLRVDPLAVASEAAAYRDELGTRAEPRTALFIGGPTHPFRFDLDVLSELIDRVLARVEESGGSLAVTTSPRTPAPFHGLLRERLAGRAWLYCFARESGRNPYRALLGTADLIVVTGDSLSMLVEVARLSRPLSIYPLPLDRPRTRTRISRLVARTILPSTGDPSGTRILSPLGYALYRAGLVRYSRDFDALHRLLVERELAAWWSSGFSRGDVAAPDELGPVTRRIEAMLATG